MKNQEFIELKKELRRGDKKWIAKLSGYSQSTVASFFADPGSPKFRNPDTKAGKTVLAATKAWIKNRKALLEEWGDE